MIRTACVAGLLTLASVALTPAQAAEIEIEAEGPVIELNIYESVTVEPDLATIGAGVNTEAQTAVEAMRANAEAMNAVIDRIKALGVAEEDIQTTGINLNARFDYDRQNREQVFRGYQVSNRVRVKLREIEEVGATLDALVAAGATDLDGPHFSIEDDEGAKEQARSRALERGMERARAYAAMLGAEDVRVLEISETLQGQSRFSRAAVAEAAADEIVLSASPVQPGRVSTGVSLIMKFEAVGAETAEPTGDD
ncbi:MAG: SIMPL domain-containing protein [Erythrobacter sp.]|uniref:SIMPL domain-containing protein n=1 Tax=Erythrobacter sp. TaxID=1042 RepID=UPI00262BD7F6|nr:SIMPL domain-containing protein [Erythrobacter sp.]MDJ0977146.1 SIMPL domain-containing protein [Erythrobacter sp.]